MDVLKRELQRKRQQLDADFGGRKVLRRAEIEAREIQRLRVAERERLLQKRQKEEQLRSHPVAASSPASSSSSMPTLPPAAVADVAKADDRADGSRESSLPREEVIRRLRLLRQPATLFGEDDAARLRRLHDALEDPAAVADVDADEIGEGQTNDFLRDIQALRAKAAAKPKAGAAERSDGVSDEKEEEVPFDELCDEGQDRGLLQAAAERVEPGGGRDARGGAADCQRQGRGGHLQAVRPLPRKKNHGGWWLWLHQEAASISCRGKPWPGCGSATLSPTQC